MSMQESIGGTCVPTTSPNTSGRYVTIHGTQGLSEPLLRALLRTRAYISPTGQMAMQVEQQP